MEENGGLSRRTKTSDDALRPRITIADEEKLHCGLTDLIARLGTIHDENPEFHGDGIRSSLLTNRQYAFARVPSGDMPSLPR